MYGSHLAEPCASESCKGVRERKKHKQFVSKTVIIITITAIIKHLPLIHLVLTFSSLFRRHIRNDS